MEKFKVGELVEVIVCKEDCYYNTFNNNKYVGEVTMVYMDGTVTIDDYYFLQLSKWVGERSKITKITSH